MCSRGAVHVEGSRGAVDGSRRAVHVEGSTRAVEGSRRAAEGSRGAVECRGR